MKFKTYYSNKFIITAILMSTLGGLILVMLPQCTEIKERERKEDSAIQLKAKIYKTALWDEYIEVFEIEGHKVIMWHNGYGSDMELIPLDDAKVFEQLRKDYEILWEENQKLKNN